MVAIAAAGALTCTSVASAADENTTVIVEIDAKPLVDALVDLSRQGNLQLVMPSEAIPKRLSSPLRGKMVLGVALNLLLKDSGLSYKFVGEHTVAVFRTERGSGEKASQAEPRETTDSSGSPEALPAAPAASGSGGMENNHEGQAVKKIGWLSRIFGFLGACATTVGNGSACAQQVDASGGSGLEEIVVTAQRRAQDIQDVPISIAAFSQKAMDEQGIRDIADIAKFTPNLVFSASSAARTLNTRIAIRGLSSDVGGPTTGIYINDSPIAIRGVRPAGGDGISSAYPQLFDVERVEVLRGPQGTLFGSGSEGGTVRFITPEPSMSGTSVYMRAGTSTTVYGAPSFEYGFAGGLPILENKLGFRGSASIRQTGGYVDHGDYYTGKVDQRNHNWEKSWNTRLALKWAVTDQLTISPSFFHQKYDVNGTGVFYLPDDVPNERLGLQPGDAGYIDTSPGSYYDRHHQGWENYGHFGEKIDSGYYVNASRVIPTSTQTMDLYNLGVEYSFSNIALISETSLYKTAQHSVSDFGFIPFGLFTKILSTIITGTPNQVIFPSDPSVTAPEFDDMSNRMFSQEVRIQNTNTDGRFNWVAGAYMQNLDLSVGGHTYTPKWGLVFKDAIPGLNCPDVAACTAWALNFTGRIFGPGSNLYNDYYALWLDTSAKDTERALFAQIDMNITDQLVITLGDRYSQMKFDSTLFGAGLIAGAGEWEIASSKTSLHTPKIGLKWSMSPQAMIYATAAKGARNGGGNHPTNDPTCLARLKSAWNRDEVPLSYDSDSVWSYELGTKFRAFNNRLVVDADIFQVDWTDMIRSADIGGDCPLSFITNLGSATSRGVEIAIQYSPIDSLTLSATGGYVRVQSAETVPVPDPSDPTGVQHNALGQPVLITRKGAVLPGSVTTTNLAAQYGFTAFSKPSYARIDYQYSGSPQKGDTWDPNSAQYTGAANLFETPSVSRANLRIGTQIDHWDVSLFVNNLMNEQPIFRGRPNAGIAFMTGSTIRPLEVGITAILRY